jgi:hypothetical protein
VSEENSKEMATIITLSFLKFNPNKYEFILTRDRAFSKKTYKRHGEFIRKSKILARKINKKQPQLL